MMGVPWLIACVFLLIPGYGTCLRDNRYLTANVTHVLDSLLANNRYDKRIRPGFGGPPITISVNLNIKSMGPVSEDDQSFGLDCYFRQMWYDTRLRFKKLPGLEEFSMSWLFLDKVWKPDTYFVNGKKSYLHRITVPNKFLRLRYDGLLTYSMRLTITASCPMYLRKFPLDAQRCPLVLGSYGYPKKDLIYQWTTTNAIFLEPDMELAQFDLVNVTVVHEATMNRSDVPYSTVQANFWLKRHTGYFMLQVYVPCGLIVLCSWVSFWIDPDDVAARVALGVTTVLSLTTMGFGGRAQLPKVSYWTALDWFVIICFTSVFSVMIEYAMVNFIDKVKKDLQKIIQTKKEKKLAESTIQKLKPEAVRERSASLAATSSVVEQPCRRISIASEVPKPPATQKFILPDVNAIKQLPRKLSTTVKEFINLGELQQKLSRSILNLAGEPILERPIPKVVVSDEDDEFTDIENEIPDVKDMVVDVDEDEWEPVEQQQPWNLLAWCRSLQQQWQDFSFLPQEADVLKILEDPEPPDKFSSIDIQARRSFPLVFFGSLTIYLIAFAYYLTDDFPERSMELLLHKQ